MNLLIMVCSFPPELSPGHLEHEMSQAFARSGHKVNVVTAFPRRYLLDSPIKHKGTLIYKEKSGNVNILKMGPEFASRDNMLARGSEYFFDFIIFGLGGLLSKKVNVILCSSPPMTIGIAGWLLARLRRIPFVVRIGDIHPQALVDLGLLNSKFVVFLLKIIERILYQKSDHIILLSEKYKQDLVSKGIQPNKISVISNWVDPEEISHHEKNNAFRKDLGTSDVFLVTYAGVMSWPQDLQTIVDAASLLSSDKSIRFVLAGDGPQKEILETKAKSLGLKNILFLSLQPRNKYINLIQTSDACLVSLKDSFKSPSVPTKLLDIMACGKPVIANVPLDGDVPKIISAAQCGVYVRPEDAHQLANAVLQLRKSKDRLLMGENAKKYFLNNFSLQSCKQKYEQILFREISKKRQLLREN